MVHRSSDPAPALTRGLRLLQVLEQEGGCSLEHLTQLTRWPKSSVARLLRSLDLNAVVRRDEVDKRYHCRMRLAPASGANPSLRQQIQREMAELCRACGQTVELHQFDGRALVMIDRCEPEDVPVRVAARVGFRRDMREADALTQIALTFGLPEKQWPKPPLWIWRSSEKQSMPMGRLRKLAKTVREQRVASDLDINRNGVRRYATPLLDDAGRLLGVLALAETFRAGQPHANESLIRAVHDAGRRMSSLIASSGVNTLN